jgi:splicing factor 45
VCSVLIFEVTEPNFPEEEAVRVYVQFQQQKEATAALLDLHGRFFGGRAVRGQYFDEIRFEKGDLAPKLGQDI